MVAAFRQNLIGWNFDKAVNQNLNLSDSLHKGFLNRLETMKSFAETISYSQLMKILSDFNNNCSDQQSNKESIAFVIDYLSYCNNQSGSEHKLQMVFT